MPDKSDNMKYADMLDMPHHISPVHPQMSMHNRAAQFSPFAALTGYDKAIKMTENEEIMSVLNGEQGEEFLEPP